MTLPQPRPRTPLSLVGPLLLLAITPLSIAQDAPPRVAPDDRIEPMPLSKLDPPPGPIAPTMKTLDEIEPRIVVNDLPGNANWKHIISEPGSYYLTGDVTGVPGLGGIFIYSNRVTLDLNGFTVNGYNSGDQGTTGIHSIGAPNSVIRNGIVSAWSRSGVVCDDNSSVTNLRVMRITSTNGSARGIVVGSNSTVRDCQVVDIDGSGILIGAGSIVENCLVFKCDETGISGIPAPGFNAISTIIRDSAVLACNYGINVNFAAEVTGCITMGNKVAGITTGRGALVTDCTSLQDFVGFRLGAGASAVNCTALFATTNGFESASGATLTRCSAFICNLNGFVSVPGGLNYDVKYRECIAQTCISGVGFLFLKPNGVMIDCISADNLVAVVIESTASDMLIDSCNIYDNETGIVSDADSVIIKNNTLSGANPLTVTGINNLIIKNIIKGGAAAVSIAPGNRDAAIVDHPDDAGPWSNLAY